MEALEQLVVVSEGDLRQAVTLLQTASKFHKRGPQADDIYELSGVIDFDKTIIPRVFNDFLDSWLSGNFDRIMSSVEGLFREGYSGLQIISQINDEIVKGTRFNSQMKQKIAVLMARTEKCIIDGADEELQILNLCAAA